jgi:hypothetical protein
LLVEGAVLSPAFDPGIANYSVLLTHESVRAWVTAASSAGATISVNGAGAGVGRARVAVELPSDAPVAVVVSVVSEDESVVREYTLTLTRQPTAGVGAPSDVRAVPGVGGAWLLFTAPTGEVRNYQVSLDGGPWVAFFPQQARGPLWVDGLTPGAPVGLRLRAVFAAGWGPASNQVGVVLPVPVAPEVIFAIDELEGLAVDGWVLSADGSRWVREVVVRVTNAGEALIPGLWWSLSVPGAAVSGLAPLELERGEVLAVNGGWFWSGLDLEPGASASALVQLALEVEE